MSLGDQVAVLAQDLRHNYGTTKALNGVDFAVERGVIFGLLGPNGGGKTTLFRILSTSLTPSSGDAVVLGHRLSTELAEIRRRIGVVFQSPSLDPKLTARENLQHHGHLHAIRGNDLQRRIADRLERLGIADRADSIVETLSGGLQRRVELAKGLLTSPELLLLDEPSTGLDPGARRDLWIYLRDLRSSEGTTILLTTHLIEEAERCDRLAVLDKGRLVVEGTPDELREKIGGDIVTIRTQSPEDLASLIEQRFGERATIIDGTLRYERPEAHLFLKQIFDEFADRVIGMTVGKPTLEDVFVRETGHTFWNEQ